MGSATLTTLEWHETTWDGRPAADVAVPKMTIARDTATITGEIEGDVADRWLMTYAADGTARFVGLTSVTGSVAGRTGTFVPQHVGRFDAEGLHSDCTVVPDSGTGELAGIAGAGTVAHTGLEGEPTRYTFEPTFVIDKGLPDRTTDELVNLAGGQIGRYTFQPGWRWSGCIKPVVGTDSCQVERIGYVVSGRLHMKHDDGTEFEVKPGDVYRVAPGHDAWVVGDEATVFVEFQGAANDAAT